MKLPIEYNQWKQLLYAAVALRSSSTYRGLGKGNDDTMRDIYGAKAYSEPTTPQTSAPSSFSPLLSVDHFDVLSGITGESLFSLRNPRKIPAPQDHNNKERLRKSAVLILLTPIQHRITNEVTTKNNILNIDSAGTNNQFCSIYNTKEPDVDSHRSTDIHSSSQSVPSILTTDLYMTLTMRSSGLRTHAAEMSFPGGRCDIKHNKKEENDGDIFGGEIWETAQEAASREAEEEIGVGNHLYDIIGELQPIWSKPSQNWVTPVVALAKESVYSSAEMIESTSFFSDPSVPSSQITPSVSTLAEIMFSSDRNIADMAYPTCSALKPSTHDATHIASPREVRSIHYMRLSPLIQPTTSPETHHRILKYYDATYAAHSAGYTTDFTTGKDKEKIKKAIHTADATKHNVAEMSGSKTLCTDTSNKVYIPLVMPCFFAANSPFFQQKPRVKGLIKGDVNNGHHNPQSLEDYLEEKEDVQYYFPLPLKRVTKSSGPLSIQYIKLINESDIKQSSLVWGLTSFMICDLIVRITEALLCSTINNEKDRKKLTSTSSNELLLDGSHLKNDVATDIGHYSITSHSHRRNITVLSPSEFLISDTKFPCGIPGLVKYVTHEERKDFHVSNESTDL